MGARRIPTSPREHAVNLAVGERIRLRRLTLGMSAERLGAAVGVSFQQIAGLLDAFSRALEVPISHFFDGIGDIPALRDDGRSNRLALALLAYFNGIEDEALQHQIYEIVKAVAVAAGITREKAA